MIFGPTEQSWGVTSPVINETVFFQEGETPADNANSGGGGEEKNSPFLETGVIKGKGKACKALMSVLKIEELHC